VHDFFRDKTTESTRTFPSEVFTVTVGQDFSSYCKLIQGTDTILTCGERIKNLESLAKYEIQLRKADEVMASNNRNAIIQFARQEGDKFVEDPHLPVELKTKAQACVIRYLLMTVIRFLLCRHCLHQP